MRLSSIRSPSPERENTLRRSSTLNSSSIPWLTFPERYEDPNAGSRKLVPNPHTLDLELDEDKDDPYSRSHSIPLPALLPIPHSETMASNLTAPIHSTTPAFPYDILEPYPLFSPSSLLLQPSTGSPRKPTLPTRVEHPDFEQLIAREMRLSSVNAKSFDLSPPPFRLSGHHNDALITSPCPFTFSSSYLGGSVDERGTEALTEKATPFIAPCSFGNPPTPYPPINQPTSIEDIQRIQHYYASNAVNHLYSTLSPRSYSSCAGRPAIALSESQLMGGEMGWPLVDPNPFDPSPSGCTAPSSRSSAHYNDTLVVDTRPTPSPLRISAVPLGKGVWRRWGELRFCHEEHGEGDLGSRLLL
ncbi:hypothetical protein NMY22_g7624 [Coprinellus aureogranulatus]|nr:hypothetical protein NMY22_g7624 [Coprinellus aureogranulatus]